MSSISLPSPIPDFQPVRRINVAEYHRMIDAGIIASGEPFELIDGLLVLKDRSSVGEDRKSIGTEHLWAVKNLARLKTKLNRHRCHIQTQGPVVLAEFDEPEQDGAIISGLEDDYKESKPSVKDVTCVIEVADSSLQHDRRAKLATYANAGIAQYVIINLPDRVVEVYTEPQIGKGRYEKAETMHPGSKVSFRVARSKHLVVPTKGLLP